MKRKFVICTHCPSTDLERTYYKSTTYKSSDWDTYGSQPALTNTWTSLLREAKVFSSRLEALDIFEKNIEDHVSMPDIIHVIQVTEKQLFKAALTEE
jgi:hypothetical protein